MFSDEERGLDDRGLLAPPTAKGRIIPYEEMRQYRAPPAARPSILDDLAAWRFGQAAEEQAKEAWKAENPNWAFDAGLRTSSGFVFSEDEIRAGLLDWFGFIPGPAAIVAQIMSIAGEAKQAMAASGDPFDDMPWELVAQIATQIVTAVVARKLKAAQAKALVKKAFEKLGLDKLVADKAAALLIRIQKVANQELKKLAKAKGFKTLDQFAKGRAWHEAVFEELKKIEDKQRSKRTGFWFSFEEPVALGSGERHEGPNIDITLYHKQRRLARIELKMSLGTYLADKTQTFMMVHDSLAMETLHLYMTPEKFVLLPDLDGGYPIAIKLR
jgi:hypothetical protein